MRRLSIALSVFCLILGAQAFSQANQVAKEVAKPVAKQVLKQGVKGAVRLAPTVKAGTSSAANFVGAGAAGVTSITGKNQAANQAMGAGVQGDSESTCDTSLVGNHGKSIITQAQDAGKVVWQNACALLSASVGVAKNTVSFTRGYLSGGTVEAAEQAAGLEPGVGAQLVENNCVTLGA